MKSRYLLFVQHPYAFGILNPLAKELSERQMSFMWYIPASLKENYGGSVIGDISTDLRKVYDWSPSVIFCPGNEVPYWMPGLKVQIFHGLAGEKKGHFRIRHYFDLYLTPGPWFTKRFEDLAKRHGDFYVTETGWSKLDPLYQRGSFSEEEESLRKQASGYSATMLYAPTFSPSLTSGKLLLDHIFGVADNLNLYLIIKFHDLMDPVIKESYRKRLPDHSNATIYEGRNILPVMHAADIMVSDTSSVVYEFLLLNKPVITANSRSGHIRWMDISDPSLLQDGVARSLNDDPFAEDRQWFVENYHPYNDGKSSSRMIEACEQHIKTKGIPESRRLSWFRRQKINRMFGKKP